MIQPLVCVVTMLRYLSFQVGMTLLNSSVVMTLYNGDPLHSHPMSDYELFVHHSAADVHVREVYIYVLPSQWCSVRSVAIEFYTVTRA